MKHLYKLSAVALLAAILLIATARPTYACSGLAWLVGICVDEINADIQAGMTDRAQIDADKEQRIAEVNAAAQQQIQQAQQQIELFKSQDAADQRRHEAELQRMQQQFDAYVTLIEAQKSERVTTILKDYETAQLALREQSDIAISGITGATSITRLRVIWGGVITLTLIIVGGLLALVLLPAMFRRPQPAQLPRQPIAAAYWMVRPDQEVRR